MKKTRKLLALLMVLAIMLSSLMFPVSAVDEFTETSEVQPRAAIVPCLECGREVDITVSYSAHMEDLTCEDEPNIPHWHDTVYRHTTGLCDFCGNKTSGKVRIENTCMGGF